MTTCRCSRHIICRDIARPKTKLPHTNARDGWLDWRPRSPGREDGAMVGFHSNSFDPQTLVDLETAFDEAWFTLKSIGNTNWRQF
jgi:hypothetical protein